MGWQYVRKVLLKYIDKESYFYNVVTWLDRLIYAPEPISSYYRSELDKKIETMNY